MINFFNQHFSLLAFIGLLVGGVYFLYVVDELGSIPTFVLAAIALFFSYLAYQFSKERFRLELLEKRWEIYEEILKYSSTVMRHAGLPKHSKNEPRNDEIIKALLSAEKSFRGLGLHKSKALFGSEVIETFEKLNKAYSYFVAQPKGNDWIEREDNYLRETWELIEHLPDIFKPYIYFGDYKK